MDDARDARSYCRACHGRRLFLFAGYATETGAENTVRPRALTRRCATCSRRVLVLGDVTDAEALVETIVDEWVRAHGDGVDALDLDDLSGSLGETLWRLYLGWQPGRLPFLSYATGILRRRLRGWIADAAGSVREHRNGHGNLVLRYPRAHSIAVSESFDAILADGDVRADNPHYDGEDGAPPRGPVGRRLAFAHGAFTPDPTEGRSLDLGWVLRD